MTENPRGSTFGGVSGIGLLAQIRQHLDGESEAGLCLRPAPGNSEGIVEVIPGAGALNPSLRIAILKSRQAVRIGGGEAARALGKIHAEECADGISGSLKNRDIEE